MNRSLLLLFALAAFAAVARAQTILPDATAGTAYSFQITTNPAQPSGAAYAANGLPTGLSIDPGSGIISGTTATVGSFNGDITITVDGTASVYPFEITVDPAAGTPVITSPGAAVGTVGTPFSYTLTASNSPTSWNIAQLPPGLTASGDVISGTPTQAGLFFTSVSGNNANGQGAILVIMWTIDAAGPVPAVTSSLLATTPGDTPFTYTITATNGPTSFAASGLPSGLSLDASTGVISGTPTTDGIYTVTLSASNQYGSGPTVNLTLTVGAYSAITSATTLTATVGTAFDYTLTATNSPYSFSLTGLPAGLSYNNVSGIVSGTPTAAGTYTLTASATNALGAGAPTTITLTVANSGSAGGGNLTAPYILAGPVSQEASVGSTIQFTVTAVGSGTLTYQWSLDQNPISGATGPTLTVSDVTAADAGTYTVTVANSIGSATSAGATLTVSSLVVPPAITVQPQNATVSVGMSTTFTVGASGSAPLSYQWEVNGTAIAGATQPTLTLSSVQLSNAGTYSVVVTNGVGSVTSEGAALTVSATAIAPIFQFQPSDVAVAPGGTASFSVGVVGSSPITYQWYQGTTPIAGAIGPSLTLADVQASDAGSYSVVITNPAGTVTSSTATLSVNASGAAPVPVSIALQPTSIAASIGSGATFSVAVTGDPTITYQWRKNQAAISGATGPTFTISNVQSSDAGTYDVVVANGFSATISFETPLIVTPVTAPSRLSNISVRAFTGTGQQALTAGFVIGGTGVKPALVRAVGPSLAQFGVTGFLPDPDLTVYDDNIAILASDAGWGGSASLSAAFAQVGAFALPATSLDSAVLLNFNPGNFSGVVTGASNDTGIVLLEVYDADTAAVPTARLVNMSVRGLAGSGDNVLTTGFVVSGSASETVLVRAIGPTLSQFGIDGVLADPQITLYDSNNNQIASNNGWGGTAALTAAFNEVYAFALPPTSADSAIMVSLAPGTYTAQVTGSGSQTGIALLEVYEMPAQ